MSFFNRTFEFKGKHAEMVRKLTDSEALNCNNIDIFILSLSLGITKGLKADPETDSKLETAKVLSEQMVNYIDDIQYFYKLLMLTDKNYCSSAEERCNKAFRYIETDKAEKDEKYFTKVLIGGLEYLYEQIIENTTSKNDIFKNICDFVETCE